MNELDIIKKRLYSVIEVGSLHMNEFLKLADIKFSEEIDSAAITCQSRPTLLLNKEFIDTYCQSDEHLFMLVMHELYHVILGHTHLFKRQTLIDNIAFDAIINAILCRTFSDDRYTSFFTSINSETSFPGVLLRPKGKKTPKEFVPILENLYYAHTGTYYEVYESISKNLDKLLKKRKKEYILLGNHIDNDENTNDPLLNKILGDVISKWPKYMVTDGRDLGGEIKSKTVELARAKRSSLLKMKRLLRKSGVLEGNISKRNISEQSISQETISMIPNYKDRTLLTKSLFYEKPLLYNSTVNYSKLVHKSYIKTLVYLDVSGSVIDDIKEFAPLLLKPYKNKEIELYAFSTIVVPISYNDFKEGKFETTCGTLIDSVFDHYFSLPRKKQTKKILILTDGYVGQVSRGLYEKIKERNVQIYVGLFGKYRKEDLMNITKYFEEF